MDTNTFPVIPVTPSPPPPAPTQPAKKKGGFAKKAVLGLLLIATIAVFATIGYVWWTESKIERIDSAELVSLATVAPGSGEPVNFLVIATDDRSSLPDDWDEDAFGDFAGRRTDVMMLAHMVPGERIQLLSLPRDLKVDIDGHGTNRLNASYVVGGSRLAHQDRPAGDRDPGPPLRRDRLRWLRPDRRLPRRSHHRLPDRRP